MDVAAGRATKREARLAFEWRGLMGNVGLALLAMRFLGLSD